VRKRKKNKKLITIMKVCIELLQNFDGEERRGECVDVYVRNRENDCWRGNKVEKSEGEGGRNRE
jgi:hypothetical protein